MPVGVGVGKRDVRAALRVGVAADFDGRAGSAAPAAVAHVQHVHAVVPVGHVGQAVGHPDVVQVLARHVDPPAAGFLDVLGIGHVQHVELRGAVVNGIQDIAVEEHVVHAAVEFLVVGVGDDGVGRIRNVQDDDAVLAIRGAFAGDGGQGGVRVHLHVVHDPSVHFDEVGQDGVGGVRHVPCEHSLAPGVRAGVDVVSAVGPRERPQVGGGPVGHQAMAHDRRAVLHASFHDLDQRLARAGAGGRDHSVESGPLRHERPVGKDRRAQCGPGLEGRHRKLHRRTLHGVPGRVSGDGREARDVSGSGPRAARDLHALDRVGLYFQVDAGLHALCRRRDLERAGPKRPQEAPFVHGGQPATVARPLDLHRASGGAVRRQSLGLQPQNGACEQSYAGVGDLHGGHGRTGHHDGRREGSHDRKAGAAGRRRPNGHAQFCFALRHALDVPVLQDRMTRLEVREDADAADRCAGGVVGDRLHVAVQRQRNGVADLDADLLGVRAHDGHAGADADRRGIFARRRRRRRGRGFDRRGQGVFGGRRRRRLDAVGRGPGVRFRHLLRGFGGGGRQRVDRRPGRRARGTGRCQDGRQCCECGCLHGTNMTSRGFQ